MAEERITISQDELDRMLTVVSNVHKDNDENERGETPASVHLSQADLDTVFARKDGQAAGNDRPQKDGIARANAEPTGGGEAAGIRARKIAERKAHSARILAQVKASSPCRIQVSYGGCVKNNSEIGNLHSGETIRLDRLVSDAVKVYVDGKLFAEGVAGNAAGVATVTLTKIVSKEI